ncbi:unnamed protein product [Oncorhynchus mykiss]|uniref:TIL domain-containing protein n=1 Tax=Oncorhynchus mykiss TaxID=8022 RepID=A0A060YD31_ONCMY|nr:unnamed protein product [Oncorhynchus mykiss]
MCVVPGQLQQDGVCVQVWQCDCVDSLGQSWAAGSWHQVDCNNCSCADGLLYCTNQSCREASCTWSSWSNWAPCSTSCGRGQRTRFRSLIPEREGAVCQFEEVQHKSCDPGPCPPLCVHDNQELTVGDTWLQGECKQCFIPLLHLSTLLFPSHPLYLCTPLNPPPTPLFPTLPPSVILSEWSEWTPCSPCVPASSLQSSSSPQGGAAALVSVQRRYRACLDLDSGQPVSGEEEGAQCTGELEEERLCPDPNACRDLCQWSVWSVWSVCQEPCSGGVRQRHRQPQAYPPGPQCQKQQTQTKSCNTGLCPGERCEDRGRVYQASCANQCPRSCTDLWEHVQCLQGVCHPGCRCPEGWLLQGGDCVEVTECRCGVPMGNGTLEISPAENVTLDCNTCVCENGTLVCTDLLCPVYGPWGQWSACSESCGTGQRMRIRPCNDTEGGPPCAETVHTETCVLPPCPGQ